MRINRTLPFSLSDMAEDNIAFLRRNVKDEDRIEVDQNVSLVQVFEGTLTDCSQAAGLYTACIAEKLSLENCKQEFLLYAMCKMKKETEEAGK